MRLLPAASRTATPWRNGGGTTTEIAAFPEGADVADFDWRVSIARIDRDGPFSSFPGVDRTLALLSGGPVTLTGPEWERILSVGSDPVAFDGADAIHARTATPSTDLNVMSRRDRCRHTLRLLALPATVAGSEQLLIATGNGIICNGTPLQPLDAVLAESGDRLDFDGPAGASLWCVSIS